MSLWLPKRTRKHLREALERGYLLLIMDLFEKVKRYSYLHFSKLVQLGFKGNYNCDIVIINDRSRKGAKLIMEITYDEEFLEESVEKVESREKEENLLRVHIEDDVEDVEVELVETTRDSSSGQALRETGENREAAGDKEGGPNT